MNARGIEFEVDLKWISSSLCQQTEQLRNRSDFNTMPDLEQRDWLMQSRMKATAIFNLLAFLKLKSLLSSVRYRPLRAKEGGRYRPRKGGGRTPPTCLKNPRCAHGIIANF